jgi:catalase
VARRRIARTSGQSASALDNEFLYGETDKTSDLALDIVGPGEVMSANQAVKISDDQNSLKAGLRGPTLMEDFHLREKITHFDHERRPERVVDARGAAAHGVFQVYEDLSDLTMAGLLSDLSRQTPVFVRFSTVAGSRGSTDCARDLRGFARSNFTPTKGFGTSSATICPFSLSRTRSSFTGNQSKASSPSSGMRRRRFPARFLIPSS